jgi:alanine dehydrogenase
MTLILGRKDIEGLLSMEMAMEAVEQAFVEHGNGRTQIPNRLLMVLEKHNGALAVMPAYMEGLNAAGLKLISHHEDNQKKHNLPESMGLIVYYDPQTGMPLAIMDCAHITRMRTGAATGVSAEYLSRKDARVLGIIGAGAQAAPQIVAIQQVRNIKEVKVYDIDPKAGARLFQEIEPLGLKAKIVENPRETCRDIDILVTCTTSKDPIVKEEWLRPGLHIAAIGADMPWQHELAPGVYARADKWVTDILSQALVSGEITQAIAVGAISEQSLYATLDEIVIGKKKGREKDTEITIYKSTGMAIQDIATARKVYELAIKKGIGKEMEITP